MNKKRLRKYPFFTLVIISSVIFGSSYLIYNDRHETPAKVPYLEYFAKDNTHNNALIEFNTEKSSVKTENDMQKDTEEAETIYAKEEITITETEAPSEPATLPPPDVQKPDIPVTPPVSRPTFAGFIQADRSYLNDALFIGDSRTSTLYEYAGWNESNFFTSYGLSVWSLPDTRVSTQSNGKMTLNEMLQKKQYPVIYIMLGINELGRGTPDSFLAQYASVIEKIRQMQPNSVIFVQAIMHVTEDKDRENTYINNNEIYARNEKLQTLADNASVFYIDNNEVFDVPGTGKLNPEYTFDGVHVKAKYIYIWEDFLLNHAVAR